MPFENKSEIVLVGSLLKKVAKARAKIDLILIDFDQLYNLLSDQEINLVKELLELNPKLYGFNGPKLGIARVPKNLVAINNQKFRHNGKIETIRLRYLPKPVYKSYLALNAALGKETGKKLLIESGYRSPSYRRQREYPGGITLIRNRSLLKLGLLRTVLLSSDSG